MKRPFGLTVVAVLMCVGAGLLALGSLAFFMLGAPAVTTGGGGPLSQLLSGMGTIGAGIFQAFAIACVTVAIYTLKLAYWARYAAIVFIAAGLLFAVIGILASLPHPDIMVGAWPIFVIAVDLWILWYLTRPHVKDAFAIAHHRPGWHVEDQTQLRRNEPSTTVIQELTKQESLDLVARSHLGRLACARGFQPYIVPTYFAYDSNCLHSFSTVGQKIEWMRDNPLVCVQVDEIVNSRQWVSVVVFGRFEELPDAPEWRGARALTHDLLERKAMWWEPGYVKTLIGGTQRPLEPVFYRIHIVRITGHRAGAAAT
jgi:nitroimidazol reductase NimA-like FMN-containing flavoprotein (pyridoxamine 5'-phosphate oxidase superfamily)